MRPNVQGWIAPTYLALCLTIGGSAQGIWSNAFLQASGLAIISFALLTSDARPLPATAQNLRWFIACLVLLFVVQLVPLPPDVWRSLPGRGLVAESDRLLGLDDNWRPISFSPFETLSTLPTIIPPIAMFVAVLRFGRQSGERLAAVLGVMAMMGVGLGALQMGASTGEQHDWYLYRWSNFGVPTGFFANGNHMAALLLCSIPFAAALVEHNATEEPGQPRRWATLAISATLCTVAVSGLLLNGSLFGLVMIVPVFGASLLVAFRHFIGRTNRLVAASVALMLGVGAVSAIVFVSGARDANGVNVSVVTRSEMARGSWELVSNHFPVGTGIGTFERAYPTIEDPSVVDQFSLNHAHNDYLELIVEGGIAAILLLIAFLAWWARAAMAMVRDRRSDGFAQAGTIAAVLLLIHSLIDFPLRTAALASVFAMSTGLMIVSRRLPRERPDLRPPRHLTIG